MTVATRVQRAAASRRRASPDAARWRAELLAALGGPVEPGPQAIALELVLAHLGDLAKVRAAVASTRKLTRAQAETARQIRTEALVWLSRELRWLGLDREQVRCLDLGLRRRRVARRAVPVRSRPKGPTILQVMQHPRLLGEFFTGDSWKSWKVVLAATFGLPCPHVGPLTIRVREGGVWKSETLTALKFYRRLTGRETWPKNQASEAWWACGVRSGKSRIAALIGTYLGCFRSYKRFLAPGEVGTLPIVAADRAQTRVVLGYTKAFFETELLRSCAVAQTAQSITLVNDVRVEVHTASFKSLRGYTVIGAVLDEIAVWQSEGSANPDSEILTALRSRLATIPIALLVAISSPYAKKGEFYETHKRYFGRDDATHTLVVEAPTWVMNPTVPKEHIDREFERDPSRALAEYGAKFRSDIERYVTIEDLEACTVSGRTRVAPVASIAYRAFLDPSGGRGDAMVLAIGHLDTSRKTDTGGVVVVDLLLAFPSPFVPSQAIASMVPFCREYRIHKVKGDRYGGEWAREALRDSGIEYELCSKGKSDLYVDLLPRLFSGSIELPDDPKLRIELSSLERRTSRSGREMIDHPPHAHDDRANAVAGLASELSVASGLSPLWGLKGRSRSGGWTTTGSGGSKPSWRSFGRSFG